VDDFMMSRQVRQIAAFPAVPGALPDDLLLLQRYGLGGPYISLSVASLLATGLTNSPDSPLGMTYGSPISWNRNWPVGQPGGGPAYELTAGSAGRPGFDFSAPVWVEGDVTALGNITGTGVYSGGFLVATVNYVTENTVASFNGRIGHVGLTPSDILLAGGVTAFDARMQGTCLAPTQWNPQQADDTIATTAFVQNAMCAFMESWLNVQNPVFTFNGRGGNVTLNLADVSNANNSIAGQYPTAPTPPAADNSTNIATTAFVETVAGGYLSLANGGTVAGATTFSNANGLNVYHAVNIENPTGALRWQLYLPNSSSDTGSGSNVGSDFWIAAFGDSGAQTAYPVRINRASGAVGIQGSNTSDSALTGFVGELLTGTATTGVALTSGTPATIATVALTGGDWDVWGVVIYAPAATTTVAGLASAVTIGGTLPTLPNLQNGHNAMNQLQATFTTGVQQVLDTGTARYPVGTAGITFTLLAQATFAVATMTATGWIAARRRR
jgi:hypothetical protein